MGQLGLRMRARGAWGNREVPPGPRALADDRYVEGVVGRNAVVVPCLHEHIAGGVRRAARSPLGAAAARTGGDLASLVTGVGRIRARGDDRLAGDGAAEAQDVRAGAGLRRERDATRLGGDAA